MQDMLSLSVKARIPLIGIQTDDVMYLTELLNGLLDVPLTKLANEEEALKSLGTGVYFMSETATSGLKNLSTLHKKALEMESSIILTNPKVKHPTIFEVGMVSPPKEMLAKLLKSLVTDDDQINELLMSLGGCGLKATSNFVMLTMARDGSLTSTGIAKTRKQFFQPSKGITQLSTEQQFYEPDKNLKVIAEREKNFFMYSTDRRMRMRGILLDGNPGIGKTEGAKWLARQWGLPLFRLDLAGVQNKYIGESQRFLQMALQQAEFESPLILLVDEVEKVMKSNSHDSSGTKDDMLSQLLWWLQEHDSRILTIMTTNNKNKIPPELIRKGRIDEHLFIEGLSREEAPVFLEKMLETFDVSFDTDEDVAAFVDAVVTAAFKDEDAGERVAHATLQTLLVKGLKKLFKDTVVKAPVKQVKKDSKK